MGWHRKAGGLSFVFEDATIDSWVGRGVTYIGSLEVQVRGTQLWGIVGPVAAGDQGPLERASVGQSFYLTPITSLGARLKPRFIAIDNPDADEDWEAFLVWLDEAMEEVGVPLGDG
jgi:hypothetical protein